MAVDYDVVVIGSNPTALLLAERAVKLKARVGLVISLNIVERSQVQQLAMQIRTSGVEQKRSVIKGEVTFSNLIQQLQEASSFYENLEALKILGVDVILETGQFSDRQTFKLVKRQLRSRTFVLAIDPPASPLRKILGLSEVSYLTCESLCQLELLPQSLVILGADSFSCILAQALNRLGVKITLITDSNHILPEVDVEAARILQAKLEVEGIEIYTASRVTAISVLATEPMQQLRVWAGDSVIDCEQILLPNISVSPYTQFNLAQAGIRLVEDEIKTNSLLQTTNKHIYVCQHRSQISTVLHNISSLFTKPQKAITSLKDSILAGTEPELASLGMTELTARLKYGQDLYVLRQESVDGEFCKLICRRNGEIVGAHILGDRAQDLISTVVIAKHHKLRVHQLAEIADLIPSTITLTAQQYTSHIKQPAWLESWFDFRRELNF